MVATKQENQFTDPKVVTFIKVKKVSYFRVVKGVTDELVNPPPQGALVFKNNRFVLGFAQTYFDMP